MNTRIRQIGNLFKRKRKNPNEGRVYDPRGLAPALGCMGGGNRMPFILQVYEQDSYTDAINPAREISPRKGVCI